MAIKGALLDTTFILGFLNDSEPLFNNADTESFKIYRLLKDVAKPKFQFVDLKAPYHETFGVLDY
jgi:hypothetical protein